MGFGDDFAKGFNPAFRQSHFSAQETARERLKAKLKREDREHEAESSKRAEADKLKALFKAEGQLLNPDDLSAIDAGADRESILQGQQRRTLREKVAQQKAQAIQGGQAPVSQTLSMENLPTAEELLLGGQASSIADAQIKRFDMEIQAKRALLSGELQERQAEEALAPDDDLQALKSLAESGGTGQRDFGKAVLNIKNLNTLKPYEEIIDFFRGRTRDVTAFDRNLTNEIAAMVKRNVSQKDIADSLKKDGITEQELKAYMAGTGQSNQKQALKELGITSKQLKRVKGNTKF